MGNNTTPTTIGYQYNSYYQWVLPINSDNVGVGD